MSRINSILGKCITRILEVSIFEKLGFLIFYLILRAKIKQNNETNRPRLFWGPVPVLNNKYWSKALSGKFHSRTVMNSFYASINKKEDFDVYADDILSSVKRVPKFLVWHYKHYFLTYYLLQNYDILHLSFKGAFLGPTRFWKKEALLFKRFGKKTVLLPYGDDAYMYSRIKDESLQNALLISYPHLAKAEPEITERVRYWEKNADFIPAGFMIDGMARWDWLVGNFVAIDNENIKPCENYSTADGSEDYVNVVHSPNHRGFKGTEFIVEAVEKLKEKGLKINLVLLEKKQNSEVLEVLNSKTDILVEQLILGYGLNAIEGLASGVPVISNLSIDSYHRTFRRYSYLNECPILSSTPESIVETLEILVKNPRLRRVLGQAGRKYVEKYHSLQFANFLFTNAYSKIWSNESIRFEKLLHPLSSDSYNNQSPKIEHPLFENRIPDELMKTLNK